MKTKSVSNVQEKCDEWLSTRNKKKKAKPTPMIKKHSAARNFVKSGSSSKLRKLTQNSPPPPQIFTNTKQSVLMSYFTSKSDSSVAQDRSFDHQNDFDVDMQEDLTEQFGFLSPDDKSEKEGHNTFPLHHPRVTQNNSTKCQVENDIESSNDDNDSSKMSRQLTSSSRHSKNLIKVCSKDNEIDFMSQNVAQSRSNMTYRNKSLPIQQSNSKIDTNSDIEFVSQSSEAVGKDKNLPIFKGKANPFRKNEKGFSSRYSKNVNSKIDTESDIEFVSQSSTRKENNVNTPKFLKKDNTFGGPHKDQIGKSNLLTDSDIEFVSQCSTTKQNNVNPPKFLRKDNSFGQIYKDQIEKSDSNLLTESDIEFVSQCSTRKEKNVNPPKLSLKNSSEKSRKDFSKDLNLKLTSTTDTDSDIEFVSQCSKNVELPKSSGKVNIIAHDSLKKINKDLWKKTLQSDTSSDDIEFLSQCPEQERTHLIADRSKSVLKKNSNLNQCQSSEYQEPDSSDIEFYSQIQENSKPVKVMPENNDKEISRKIPQKDKEECRHSMDKEKHKCNKDLMSLTHADHYMKCGPEISSEDSEIEFISQSAIRISKSSYKFCDHVNPTNNFRNHTLNISLNTEDLSTPYCLPDLNCDSQAEHCRDTLHSSSDTLHSSSDTLHSSSDTLHSSSDTLHSSSDTLHSSSDTLHTSSDTLHSSLDTLHSSSDTLQPEDQSLEEQTPDGQSPAEQRLHWPCLAVQSQAEPQPAGQSPQSPKEHRQMDDISFDSVTDSQVDDFAKTSAEKLKQKQNKGENSLRHKSRLLQKFLPDTIKFTDTETDSCDEPPLKVHRSGYHLKRSSYPDSDVFTLQDTQIINVHINQSKRQ